jgi:hypothetical protein
MWTTINLKVQSLVVGPQSDLQLTHNNISFNFRVLLFYLYIINTDIYSSEKDVAMFKFAT